MKKIGIIDIVVSIAVIIAMIVGFFTYAHFRNTADKQIESTSKIAFQVFLRGVTLTGNYNPIRRGDATFISIRNVPYTKLQVVDSRIFTKKIVLPNAKNPTKFLVADDYSQFLMYDIVVTITDVAKITKDGAVVGGNKIKIGLPVTLEGVDYKFNGTVSNIQLIKDKTLQEKTNKKAIPAPMKLEQKPQSNPIKIK
jgi:hypothetical protein